MATVRFVSGSLTGVALTLKLYPLTTGTLANTGGDSFTESGVGYFSATVAESLTGIYRADILSGSSVLFEGFVDMSAASPIVLSNYADVSTGGEVTIGEFSDDALAQIAANGPINYRSPINSDGVISLVTGDDYLTDDDRELNFYNTAGSWPDLTSATIAFRAKRVNGTALSDVVGEVIEPTGVDQQVDVELPRSWTVLLTGSCKFSYELEAVLSNGDHITLETGTINVTQQIG